VGIVSKEDAYALGAVGPTARGSGIVSDMRKLGYAAYKEIDFEPIVESAGDSYARCMVRIKEIFQSIDIIAQAAEKMVDGPIDIKVSGTPNGDFLPVQNNPA
jgi:ech hydrogenase subunit E